MMMEAVNFKKNSWHGRLAFTYGQYSRGQHGENICPYARKVMLGFFIVAFITGAISIFLTPIAFLIANFVVLYQTGVFSFDDMFRIFLVEVAIIVGLAGLALFMWIAEKRHERKMLQRDLQDYELRRLINEARARGEEYVPPEPPPKSFLKAWFDHLHDKTCFKINFR